MKTYMILHVYIIVIILAFLTFLLGIYLGSSQRKSIFGDGQPIAETIVKKGAIVTILLLSATLFGIASYASFNVETTECLDATTTITQIDTNTTEEVKTCDPYVYRNDVIAYFFSALVIVAIVLSLIYMF